MANINIAQIIQESLTADPNAGTAATESEVNESAGNSLSKYMDKAKQFASDHKGAVAGAGAAMAGAGAGLKSLFSKKAAPAPATLMDKAKGAANNAKSAISNAANTAKTAATGAAGDAKNFVNSHRGAVAGTTLAAIGAGVGAKALLRYLRKKKKAA